MDKRSFIFLIIFGTVQLVFGQTGEFQYFFDDEYFDDELIQGKSIKTITKTSFIRLPNDTLSLFNLTIYRYNKKSELVCSESYYYQKGKPDVIESQTIDSMEYSQNGFQTRHLRFHFNKDSAEWIQEFSYVVNDHSQIIKLTVNDLTVPRNSHIIKKTYDTENRLVKTQTDFGYSTKYIYDNNGNLIEKIVDNTFGINRYLFKYDDYGNTIGFKFIGMPMDNFDIVEKRMTFDGSNRLNTRIDIRADKTKIFSKYSYYKDTLIRREDYNSEGEIFNIQLQKYEEGLIQTVIEKRGIKIHSKDIFDYEFFE